MSGTDNGIKAGLFLRGRPRFPSMGHEEARTMATTTTDKAEVFSRPAARFDEDGNIEVRASSALGCRRALWYSATGYEPTNSPSEDSLTAMEAGNALEPVVAHAMERAGWQVNAADPQDPQTVTVRIGPNPVSGTGQALLVTGHPDGTVRLPLPEDEAPPQLFLFDDEPDAHAFGDPMVVEIKTRGPEAFKRWRTLGAERSHPASVAQAAFYTLGHYGDLRDAVIATMDTGNRTWDWERIPADRLERALQAACEWLGELAAHHVRSGPDPDAPPGRDFSAGSWQCRSCPFLDICLPGAAEEDGTDGGTETEEVSDEEARDAVAAYAEAQDSMKEPEKAKRGALDTLKAWMRRQGDSKATVGGRTVTLVSSTRYSVNHRRLNEALDPEVRAEIVTESESEYVRVS